MKPQNAITAVSCTRGGPVPRTSRGWQRAWFWPLALAVLGSLLSPGRLAAAADGPVRAAVIVGANAAAPGRRPLRFGHRDARAISEALTAVAGFAAQDIQLLTDPEPEAVVAAVKAAGRRLSGHPESLIYFYYSGHADDASLFPGGKALPTATIRAALDAAPAKVKVGIVDACRGGAWTRAKGLTPDQPFAVEWPLGLDSEGSVLIASSSGLESAHESDQLEGSFFTHHLVGALRGAADRNHNGEVTLTEAFEYAKAQTIRDTVRFARETQHPSFHVNLRGRRELVLARLGVEVSTLEVSQTSGPLELIHAGSGITLLELPPGPREVRLAVPPGAYLLRKTFPGSTLIKEIDVAGKGLVRVEEAQLTLVGESRLSAKAPSSRAEVFPISRPPAVRGASSGYVKPLAIGSAVAATLALGLAVKLHLDQRGIDQDLDPYRRYPCDATGERRCDESGMTELRPPTTMEEAYALALQEDRRRLQRTRNWMLVVGGGLAAVSVPFFYRWRAGGTDTERGADLALGLRLGAGSAGIHARLHY